MSAVAVGSLAVATAPDAAELTKLGKPGPIDGQTGAQDSDSEVDNGPEGGLGE